MLRNIIILFLLPVSAFSQINSLEGIWRVTCALEKSRIDTSIIKCSICDLEKSENPKIHDQFIMRFDKESLTITKMGTTKGTTIPYLLYPKEQILRFKIDENVFLFRIIIVGKDYILNEESNWFKLLMEKVSE